MRPGETPVPIPNTMVKTRSADGTILETVWESRWMPLHIFLNENEQSEVRIKKNSTPHRAKRDDCVTTAILSEDERKRSLRLENKHTLRSIAKQWCYQNLIIRAYSSAG